MQKQPNLMGHLVNWKGVAAASTLIIIALILLWVSSSSQSQTNIWLAHVIPAFASVVATSGVFALVYEIFVRRQQTDFVLASIGLKESLIEAGLDDVSVNYLDFDYAKEIQQAKVIRLFVLYAQTWLNRYSVELTEHLCSDSTVLELVVPSLDNRFLQPLAEHFEYSEGDIQKRISESITLCVSPALEGRLGKDAVVRVYMHSDRPSYSMYQFDKKLLVGTYYASRARRRAPMFLFKERPGSMFDEFDSDLTQVMEKDSEIIFDSAKNINLLKEKLEGHLSPELEKKLQQSND